jgi:hypothetical protein
MVADAHLEGTCCGVGSRMWRLLEAREVKWSFGRNSKRKKRKRKQADVKSAFLFVSFLTMLFSSLHMPPSISYLLSVGLLVTTTKPALSLCTAAMCSSNLLLFILLKMLQMSVTNYNQSDIIPQNAIFKFNYNFLFNHPNCSSWKHNCVTLPINWHIFVCTDKEAYRMKYMCIHAGCSFVGHCLDLVANAFHSYLCQQSFWWLLIYLGTL